MPIIRDNHQNGIRSGNENPMGMEIDDKIGNGKQPAWE